MPAQFRVVIVGAGIGGLAASIGFAQRGHSVTIVESSPSIRAVGSVLTIPANSCKVLDSYGVLSAVQKRCVGDSPNSIWKRYTGEFIVTTDKWTEADTFGYKQTWLLEQMARTSIPHYGSLSSRTDKISIGHKSRVRQLVGSLDVKIDDSLEISHVYLPLETITSDPALAHLVGPATMWMGPGRVAMGIALRRDTSDDIWVSEFAHRGMDGIVGDWGKSMEVQLLKDMHTDFDADLTRILDKADSATVWKLVTVDALSHSWLSKSGKIALIGDAVHAMPPHFAQGAAMAVEDGASLAQCLSRASTTEEIPKACQAWEQIRKPRVAFVQNIATENSNMMMLPDGKGQQGRDMMFKSIRGQKDQGTWDGVHIDEVPKSRKDPTFGAFIYGHDAIGFKEQARKQALTLGSYTQAKRKLDEVFPLVKNGA
ncbi:hypothetical protein BKA65DRAFT_485147 [Rhexocercosporidium sp. MPI-PUGE-AT-0058]|nr:hypothetical protein BKA65DRAFT_485147 [Rhexocercosporidium sp. MPI-PUGE-AT-0058]